MTYADESLFQEHGGILEFIPGRAVPIRNMSGTASPDLLRKQEIDKLEITSTFKVKLFDMAIPEHVAEYQKIIDNCISGWYKLTKREYNWVAEATHPKIWLEWIQQYHDCG